MYNCSNAQEWDHENDSDDAPHFLSLSLLIYMFVNPLITASTA